MRDLSGATNHVSSLVGPPYSEILGKRSFSCAIRMQQAEQIVGRDLRFNSKFFFFLE